MQDNSNPPAVGQTARFSRRRAAQLAGLVLSAPVLGISLSSCTQAPAPVAQPTPPPSAPPPTSASNPTPAPAAAAKPAAVQAPPPPKTLIKWRHLEPTRAASSAFRLAIKEQGLDREYGIDAEIISISGGGATLVKALIAGEAESAEPGFPPITPSIEEGADLKLLGAFIPGPPMAFYVRKEINSLADLYGKNVGISGVGSLFHQLTRLMMMEDNLDPEQVTYINVGGGSPANFQAVTVGKIDAGVAASDFIKKAEEFPDIKVLFRIGEKLPKFIYEGFITTNAVIRDQPDALTSFLLAYTRGHRYALDHPEETSALASKLTGRDPEESRWEIEQFYVGKLNNPNFEISPDGLRYMQEAMVKLGEQKQVMPEEQVIDRSFQQKVIAQLGPYQPGANG